MNNVVITGCTGILGRAVALDTLRAGDSVTALVRARDREDAYSRVAKALGPEISNYKGKIFVICADLTLSNLGIDKEGLKIFQNRSFKIIHCAGDVSFSSKDKARVMETNIEGTKNLLNFLLAIKNCTGFVHVSTAYVCGDATGDIYEDDLELGQKFYSHYEHSKYEAERIVRQFQKNSTTPILIIRPSVILENSNELKRTRLPAINSIIIFLVEVFKEALKSNQKIVRVPARADAIADLVPIEYVTKTIISLSQNLSAYGKTFNLTNPNSPSVGQIIEVLNKVCGQGLITFICMNPNEINIEEMTRLERMLLINLQPYVPHLSNVMNFDVSNVEKIRASQSLPDCPPISQEKIIHLIQDSIDYAYA